MAYTCPCCGYPALQEPPRSNSGGGSYEICPSCGFQFGVSDDDAGFTYAQWRAQWKASGMPWSSKAVSSPLLWDARVQLERLRKISSKIAEKKQSSPRKKLQ